MWSNRYDLAIRQQFRADFRMTPDTFMDTFILVRNRLEKQDTRFREAFPIEKRVAIAFRSSHQPKSTGKRLYQNLFFNNVDGLTLGTLLKNEALAQVLSCEFCKVSKDTFLQNTSGRLLLCFMAFSDWEFLQQRFKNICCSTTVASIIVYQNILSNFREPQVEQPKQLLHLKKPLTVKNSSCCR